MAIIPVLDSNVTKTGRIDQKNDSLGNTVWTFKADFSVEATYVFDLSAVDQQGKFGTPQSIFVDNSANPSEIEVTVSGTQQYFTIPPLAEGYFNIDALPQQASISFRSVGGATRAVTIGIYNTEQSPQVWYRFGGLSTDKPFKMQGSMSAGTTISGDPVNNPVYIAGIAPDGKLKPLSLDAQGNINFGGTINISNVKITSADDVAWRFSRTDQALGFSATASVPEVNAWQRFGAGLIQPSAAGGMNVAAAATPITALSAQLDDVSPATVDENNFGALRMTSDRSLMVTSRSGASTVSNVAQSATSVVLFAANPNRKGAVIYNESQNYMYVALAGTCSTTSYTVRLNTQDHWEVPYGYTGAISAVWSTGGTAGPARLTELS